MLTWEGRIIILLLVDVLKQQEQTQKRREKPREKGGGEVDFGRIWAGFEAFSCVINVPRSS